MINSQRVMVKIGKTWHLVFGQEQDNGNFVYILNGRVEQVTNGYWYRIDKEYSQIDAENEVVRMNIHELSHRNPRKFRVADLIRVREDLW